MDKKSALSALRVIHSSIQIAAQKKLSSNEVIDLRCACNALIESIKDDEYVAEKTALLVEHIIAVVFLKSAKLGDVSSDFILDYIASLSVFIDSQPGSVLAPATMSPLL